jgi:hypothetical protein
VEIINYALPLAPLTEQFRYNTHLAKNFLGSEGLMLDYRCHA